ncbi:MAG: chaperone NapD [Desulfovibrio sp.]|jgi:nitrate reductase NapAB chaperone NapD|nr:chaperone NapD [Desulfovibrio sp.]
MAILGFLTHVLAGQARVVEDTLKGMPEFTTYGIHKDSYLVVVAEAPSEQLEGLLDRVRGVQGVLAVYVTSLTREDEDLEKTVPAHTQPVRNKTS